MPIRVNSKKTYSWPSLPSSTSADAHNKAEKWNRKKSRNGKAFFLAAESLFFFSLSGGEVRLTRPLPCHRFADADSVCRNSTHRQQSQAFTVYRRRASTTTTAIFPPSYRPTRRRRGEGKEKQMCHQTRPAAQALDSFGKHTPIG